MGSFNVVQILPEANSHLQAFTEIGELVEASLADLGHEVSRTVNTADPGRQNIVLGGHVLSVDSLGSLPKGTIIYNFEQIDTASMMPPARLGSHAEFTIWDYSTKNVSHWREQGLEAVHVPVGFHPCLQRLEPASERPIDALFYGSMNPRRRAILDLLDAEGVRTDALFGVYGSERDSRIEHSKLVLNIHFYEAKILETARLSYLFSNGIPVVSEWSDNLEIPEGLSEAAAFAEYDDLAVTVVQLLENPEALAQQGKAGATAFSQLSMSAHLAKALDHEPKPASVRPPNASPASRRRVMFVVGCHRSGTSMVSRILNLGGFELTGPMIAPAADNPTGFWEDQRIAILDDQILRVLGSRWDDVLPTPSANWRQHPHLGNIHDELRRHLGASSATDLLVKDPRITVLFPMWRELIEGMGWDVQTAFVIRDPRAVAESLHRRNGFSRAKGISMWLHHTLMGELHTRSVPRILLDYDTLLGSIDDAVSKLHHALSMTTALEEYRSAALAHVAADLNHGGSYEASAYEFPAAALALEVYAGMRGGATSQELDGLRTRFLDAAALMGPVLAEFRRATLSLVDQL